MRAGPRIKTAIATAALLGCVAATAPASGSDGGGTGGAGKRAVCFQETRNDLGADYVYELKVHNLGCDKGENLVKKYHACRHDHGGWNGHCGSFKGYTCTEKKTDSAPGRLQAKGTCVKGSHKFVNFFGENR